ncbi:MAG: CBS domain-containing protein [Anaerolineaceae bacterium]|nr:CBS domain-containing protein [Anaerolineaceae bacterium]
MATVQNLLDRKGITVWSIAPGASVESALSLMSQKDIGALLVMDAGKIVGIFSERDYVRKIISNARISMATPVKEFMSHPVFYVSPQQTVDDCMSLMTAKHIRHLPVMDGEKLAGLISIGDVVKQVITEKEGTIQDLENYITGREYNL